MNPGALDIYADSLTEAEQRKLGALLAAELKLRRTRLNPGDWQTASGSKTDLGLCRTVLRILREGGDNR